MASNTRPKGKFLLILIVLLIQGCGVGPSPAELPVMQTATKPMTFTMTPSRTPSPSPTPDFIATNSVNALVTTVRPRVLDTYLSPDEIWTVEIIRYNCVRYAYEDYRGILAYEQVQLRNLSDGTVKIVDDQLQACDGIGTYGFDGLYWSPSGRFFYYTDSREGYPGGCGNYIMPAIYRLDTVTQTSIMVGGAHISPDETRLAMWDGDDIVIWDLDRGEIGRVRSLVPGFLAGEIAWAPDSQSLVYLQTEFDCAPDYGVSYLILMDLGKMSQTLLVKYPPPGFGGVDWHSAAQVTLWDGDGNYWTYDLSTKEKLFLGRTPFTPTPVPVGIFALLTYPPLVMDYDVTVWEDESQYAEVSIKPTYSVLNYLKSLSLETCQIGIQGPTGDFPLTPEAVQLDSVKYEVITYTDSPPGFTTAYFIENKSLIGFNYEAGTSVLVVQASLIQWNECKTLAEKVLSTLRVP